MAKAAKPSATADVPSDLLQRITAKARQLLEAKALIENVEERLKQLNIAKYNIEREQLPELMAEAGVTSLDLAAQGNDPAYTLKMEPFYQANIAAGWDEEKRKAAFSYLASKGAQDLIKTELKLAVPREHRAKVATLIEAINSDLTAAGVDNASIEVKEAVHSATLTSWLREVTESGEDVDLEKIGGQVGTIVKPKAKRGKK